MHVPWRKVNAKFKTSPFAGFGQISDHITLAILPGTAFYTMIRVSRRPQAETVMVFCSQYEHPHPGSFSGFNPLIGIQGGWSENVRIFYSCAPFPVGKSVDTEMDEPDDFHLLISYLFIRRDYVHGGKFPYLPAGGTARKQEQPG
jgi:hypothetical protein